jgi:glycosyltransferase involved in cell wall biosynthesis
MTNNQRPKLLIVTPAYNEAANLSKVVASIKKFKDESELHIRHIILNDGSKDNSSELLQKLNVEHVNLVSNIGIAAIFRLAFQIAKKTNVDYLMIFDGDGQHDSEEIQKLLNERDSADVLIGARNRSEYKMSKLRRTGQRIFSVLINRKFGVKLSDPTSGMRLFSKKSFDVINDSDELDSFLDDTVMANVLFLQNSLKIVEIEIRMLNRQHGKPSSQGFKIASEYLSLLLRLTLVRKI